MAEEKKKKLDQQGKIAPRHYNREETSAKPSGIEMVKYLHLH